MADSPKQRILSGVRCGALAGAISAFVFTGIHDLLISDIWNTLAVMLGAGAICGLFLGWSFSWPEEQMSLTRWLGFNAVYILGFACMGAVSVIVFEPITDMATVIESNRAPTDLIKRALPLTLACIAGTTVVLGILFSRRWTHIVLHLVTSTLLFLVLGVNVSIIGLVRIPMSGALIIGELFGLTALLAALFAAVFFVLEKKTFLASNGQ